MNVSKNKQTNNKKPICCMGKNVDQRDWNADRPPEISILDVSTAHSSYIGSEILCLESLPDTYKIVNISFRNKQMNECFSYPDW